MSDTHSESNLAESNRADITITFPDGKSRKVAAGTTGLEIAKSISPSLAKRTVAMTLDGVLSDLAEKIHPEQLATLSATFERPIVQRLGHLLDRLGHEALTTPMLEALQARGDVPWTELDRQQARDPDFAPEPQERDSRWHVIVRRIPELDE